MYAGEAQLLVLGFDWLDEGVEFRLTNDQVILDCPC